MREQELPDRWRRRVLDHALAISGGKYRSLGVSAFGNRHVRVSFPDGSEVLFRYAFVLSDEESGELGVFTEHCGYHVFPLEDAVVEVVDEKAAVDHPNVG